MGTEEYWIEADRRRRRQERLPEMRHELSRSDIEIVTAAAKRHAQTLRQWGKILDSKDEKVVGVASLFNKEAAHIEGALKRLEEK